MGREWNLEGMTEQQKLGMLENEQLRMEAAKRNYNEIADMSGHRLTRKEGEAYQRLVDATDDYQSLKTTLGR